MNRLRSVASCSMVFILVPCASAAQQRSSPELCVKERGSSSMLRLGCLGELLGLEE